MVSGVDSSDSSYYFQLLAQQEEDEETLAEALEDSEESSSTSSTSTTGTVQAADTQSISDFLAKDQAGEVDDDYIETLLQNAASSGQTAQGSIFDVMA